MLSIYVSLAWFICSNARSCGGVLDPPAGITFRESGSNKCGWQIPGVAAFMRVTFTLVDMAFEPDCRWNYIAIYDGDRENSAELKRLCGHYASPVSFYSTTGRMYILLGTQNTTEYQAFTANFTSLARISRGKACGGDKIDVGHCETGTVCVNSTNDACPLNSTQCTCKLARTLDQHCGSARGSPPRPCATGTICLTDSKSRCSNNDTVTGCFCRGVDDNCHDEGCTNGYKCSNLTNMCESETCNNYNCEDGSTCLTDTNEYCTHASTCTCVPDIASNMQCGGDRHASRICKDPLFCLTSVNAFCPHGAALTDCTCKHLACHDITDGDTCAFHIGEGRYGARHSCIWCCGDLCSNSESRTDKKCVPKPRYTEWTTPGKHRGSPANCSGVYSAGNCSGNNTQSCVSGTVCLTATNAVCQRDVPMEDCTCKPLVHAGDNCGGGRGTDNYSQVCATGYVCLAQEKKCPLNASVEDCTCKPACTRPETLTGYNLDYVKEDLARGSFNVSNVTCAPGYSGNVTARECKSAGEHYALSGCDIRMCTRPGTLTGYNLEYAKEDLDEGSFGVTNLTCAPGYSGNATAQKCNSAGEHYVLSGCTLGPDCFRIQEKRFCTQMRSKNGEPCVWFCGRSSGSKCGTLNTATRLSQYNGICPTCTNDTYSNGTGIIAGTGDCSWRLEGAANEVIRLFITKFDCPRNTNGRVALSDGALDQHIVYGAKNFRVVYGSVTHVMYVDLSLPLWNSGCNFSATFTKTSVVDAGGACHGTGDGPLPCVKGTTCATSANQLCAWKGDPSSNCTCKYPVPSKSYCGGGTDRVSSFCEVGNKCVTTSDGQACPFGFDVDKCWCQSGCGGDVEGRSGSFSSYQGVYKNERGVNCTWRIQGEAPDLIRITFHHSTIRYHSSCWNDYVQVSEGKKWCEKDLAARTFYVPSPANVKLMVDDEEESHGSGFSLDFSVIALNETAEYSEIKRFGECNSTNQLLAEGVSLKNCADICHFTSGCQYFIFAAKSKECYQEDTRTSSCSEGWKASEFNFYALGRQAVTVQAVYKKLHKKRSCGDTESGEIAMVVTLQECANICQLAFGCRYFLFPTSGNTRRCYREDTQSRACIAGWKRQPDFDFYELQETEAPELAVVITSTVATTIAATVEPAVVVTSTVATTIAATAEPAATTIAATVEPAVVVNTTIDSAAATVDTTINSANTSANNIVTGAEGYDGIKMAVIVLLVVAVLFVSVFTISCWRYRNAAQEVSCEEI